MKTPVVSIVRRSFPLASALAALLAGQSAQAITYYWDGNNGTANFGSASGTWEEPTTGTANSGWSTSAAGTTAISGNSITTLLADILNFGTDTAGRGLGTGTITVSGTVDATQLRFGSQTTGNVTLSGGIINLAAAGNIHVGAGSTTVHTVASQITGAGTSLTKTGNTLRLSANNSYTGQTIISSGTLILNNAMALGGSTLGVDGTSSVSMGANSTLRSDYVIVDGGATDSYVYAPITLTAAGTNNFHIGNGNSASPAESVTYRLNGAIGGTAGANVVFGNTTASRNNADSIIVLGAAATYDGDTTIQAGNTANRINVRAGVADALPTTTVLSFDAVGGSGTGRTTQFDLNGNNQTLAGLDNGGTVAVDRNIRVTSGPAATLTINNAADLTFGGAHQQTTDNDTLTNAQITGAVSLVKSGAGTFTLGGTLTNSAAAPGNAFTGSTTILGGILVLGESTSIRNSAFDTAASIAGDGTNGLRSDVTTLTLGGLTGGNDFSTRFTSAAGGYTGLTALTLNPASGATRTYAGDIGDGAGAMNLTKSGAGTQILTGTNTHAGTTTVTAGVLITASTAALPGYNSPGKVIFNGGTIGAQVGGAGWTTAEVDTLLANATKTSGFLGIDTTNGNFLQWTPFTTTNFGPLGLNKLGPNDLTLNEANTYTGTTTITEGTLTLANANALQNSTLVTTSAGTITLGTGTVLNLGGLSGATGDLATVVSNYSTVTAINLDTPATLPGAALGYGGIISDGVPGTTLTKNGSGVQVLSGTNTYTGATQVNDGILVFRNKAAKPAGIASSAAAGSIGLGVKDADAAFYSAAEVGDLFNTNSLTGFNLDPASGVVIDTTAASTDQNVALTAARSLTKNGGNTLTLSQVNTYSGATTVTAGTLSLTGSLDGGGAISTLGTSVFSETSTGVISGAATFTQDSTGTSTLAGTNTYTGATTVNLGTLAIANNDALGTTAGATTINGGNGTNAVSLSLTSATSDLVVAEPLNFNGNTAGRAQLVNASAQNHTLSGPINVTSDTNIAQFTSNSTGSITLSGDISGTFTNGATLFLRGASTSATNRVTGSINLTGGNFSKTDGGTWLVGTAGETYSWQNTSLFVGTLTMGAASVLPSATILTMGNSTGDSTPALDLNGFSQTIAGINYGGEGVATGTKTITSASTATLTVNNATDFITTGTNVSTNNVVLTGALALTKQGAGKLELNGVNTNSGNTTVSEGILSLTKADSAADANTGNIGSTVTIATTGATLDLAFTGTDIVDKLFIGGVQKAPGVYGPSATPLTQITGTGTLTVNTGPAGTTYASWVAGFGLAGMNALSGSDPDFDTIPNAVEMVLGGNPATVMDLALMPTLELVTDPAGVPAGDYFLFTFRRSDLSVSAGVTSVGETDTDLVGSWTPAVDMISGVVIQVDNDFAWTNPSAANTDRVRVYVPRGANLTMFGRLNVVVP